MWTVDQARSGEQWQGIREQVRVDALTVVPALTFQDGKAKQHNADDQSCTGLS
jgi:hypothetical protein